jgi:C-terminal processing protease CtpA/Prc
MLVPSFVRIPWGLLAFVIGGCATHSTAPATARVGFIADPCAHLRGGPPGTHSPNSDLGRAHALVRYFGVERDPLRSDERLAEALDAKREYTPPGACRAPAESSKLGPVQVTMKSGVALVKPGIGDVVIPANARAIAVDVTDLPADEDAEGAIKNVLHATLHGDARVPEMEIRRCNGHPDEVYSLHSGNSIEQYACKSDRWRRTVHGDGRALPIAVITGQRLTPLAAWTAAFLRSTEDAFIVGADVPTVIAESRWVGIGNSGLAVRIAHYPELPDVLTADATSLAEIDWAGPRRRTSERATRPSIGDLDRVKRPARQTNGDGRAALIVAYAATRTFFPYLEEVGDTLDARLEESIAMLGPDRASVTRALGRYSEALHDGHVVVRGADGFPGSRASFESVGSDWVVANDGVPGVQPGDVLLAIDGEPIATRVAEIEPFLSGSPQAIKARISARFGGRQYTLRTPEGATRTVDVKPAIPHFPHHDPFKDGIVYVDMSHVVREGTAELHAMVAKARGMILDMRGYPSIPAMDVLGYVLPPSARGPEMAEIDATAFGTRRGPWEPPQRVANWSHVGQGYEGPVVMLAGPNTQSRAEHFMTFFISAHRGKVIGSATSGANGTITGVQLPGGYSMLFTGMFVRQPDGSRFHAIGHLPDIAVEPTIDDLAHGRDVVLDRAVLELTRNISTSPQ